MFCWESMECLYTGADGDCGDDYDISDGGGGDKHNKMMSLTMMMMV